MHASFATYPAWLAWATGHLARLPFSFTAHAYDVQEPRTWLARVAGRLRSCARSRPKPPPASVPPPARWRGCGSDTSASTSSASILGRRGGRSAGDSDRRADWTYQRGGGVDRGRALAGGRRNGPRHAPHASACASWAMVHCVSVRGTCSRAGPPRGRVFRWRRNTRRGRRRFAARHHLCTSVCAVRGGARHDGLPVALLEAMASALPVVSTPVGGIPEAVTDGDNGILVPPGDAHRLATALAILLNDTGLRRRLGAAARARVLRQFRGDAAAARLAAWMADAKAKFSGQDLRRHLRTSSSRCDHEHARKVCQASRARGRLLLPPDGRRWGGAHAAARAHAGHAGLATDRPDGGSCGVGAGSGSREESAAER